MSKILIIDDDPNIQTLLKNRLENAKFEVTSAGDAFDGIKKIQSENPDLILVDVIMPEMSGYQFVKFLNREAKQFSHIPIIAMSAKESMSSHFDSWDIQGFMPKPIDHIMLIEKIHTILDNKSKKS